MFVSKLSIMKILLVLAHPEPQPPICSPYNSNLTEDMKTEPYARFAVVDNRELWPPRHRGHGRYWVGKYLTHYAVRYTGNYGRD